MLNVAILSGWHVHAEGYAKKFQSMAGSRVSVVWDEEPERGKKFAANLGVPFEPDLGAVLKRDDVDCVCVNAPTSMHREVMVAAANAKKHIFTEKVLAITNEDANAIRKAVLDNGVKFVISFPHRGNPATLFAKEALAQKLLGTVTLMRVRNSHNGSGRGWLPPHFYVEETCGGGAMMDLGAHPMYLVSWLMGRPLEVSSVFTAVTGHALEDNAVSVFKYEGGAIAISETGFVSEYSPFMLELYGTEGSILINQEGVKINSTLLGGKLSGWVTPSELPKALPEPCEQFINAIADDAPIHYNIDEAVALTEIMVAAYKSSREGRAVKF